MEFIEIPGFDGMYFISKSGSVKVLRREWVTGKNLHRSKDEHIINPFMKRNGYLHVAVLVGGKQAQYPLHSLLAKVFIPNPENKKCVNHKDGNKLNNSLDNLEWATYQENAIHALSTGLKVNPSGLDNGYSQPVEVFKDGKKIGSYPAVLHAAKALGISNDRAYRIMNRQVANREYEIVRITRKEFAA